MYYLELMFTLFFLLLLGAFVSPVLGGCMMLIMVMFILSGLIIFFSINFVWFLAAGLLIYAGGIVLRLYRWYRLPDFNQYVGQFPNCKRDVGVSCHRCSSEKLVNHGLLNSKSKWRFYICQSCGTTLFRFKVL